MKTFKKARRVIQELDEIYCNKCSQGIFLKGWPDNIEYFSLKDSFGFGSKYDGTYFDIDICRDCLVKFIKTCKINPLLPEGA